MKSGIFGDFLMGFIRYDWNFEELEILYELPLLELISKSNTIHNQFHQPGEIQVCNLISIKTGGCPEDPASETDFGNRKLPNIQTSRNVSTICCFRSTEKDDRSFDVNIPAISRVGNPLSGLQCIGKDDDTLHERGTLTSI